MQKAIGKDCLITIEMPFDVKTGDFLIAEDIYGNKYKYTLEPYSVTDISIGLPESYNSLVMSTVSENE